MNFFRFALKNFYHPIVLLNKIKKYMYLKKLKKNFPHQYKIYILKYQGARIGENCIIMSSVTIAEPVLVTLGDNVFISGNCFLLTHDGSPMIFKETSDRFIYKQIKIGSNVFIGIGVIILPGVVIGDNVIIGAGSVIRENIPSDSVVMGNPAKIIFKTSIAKRMVINNKRDPHVPID